MKAIVLSGEVIEVGMLDSAEGEPMGIGAYIDCGGESATFVPLTREQAQEVGAHLYKRVTITIEVEG